MKISEIAAPDMRKGFVAFVLALPLLVTACDPGVIIRQADSPNKSGKLHAVTLRVKSAHEFIGTTYYAPQVTVENNSDATVLVTAIELATKQRIYTGSSPRPQDLPGEVLAKQAHDFAVLFRFDEAVYKSLKEPAELRVHYRSGGSEDTARLTIVLGSLDDTR